MSLAQWIDRHAGFTPEQTALRFGDETITYREMASHVARAAGVLRGV